MNGRPTTMPPRASRGLVGGEGSYFAKTVYTVYDDDSLVTPSPIALAHSMTKKVPKGARQALRKSGVAERSGGAPEKVIRDSFTMPRGDYELIGVLKQRCIGLGIARSKSELLRAGLTALNQLPDGNLTRVVAAVESVKTGRPRGAKKKKKKAHRAKGKKK